MWSEKCTSLCILDMYCTYILPYIYCNSMIYAQKWQFDWCYAILFWTLFQGTSLKFQMPVPVRFAPGSRVRTTRVEEWKTVEITIKSKTIKTFQQAIMSFPIQLLLFGYLQSLRKVTNLLYNAAGSMGEFLYLTNLNFLETRGFPLV